jgi:hypothetical protein
MNSAQPRRRTLLTAMTRRVIALAAAMERADDGARVTL